MRDTERDRHLLGLEQSWTVTRLALDVKERRVDAWVDHARRVKRPCPACDRDLPRTVA